MKACDNTIYVGNAVDNRNSDGFDNYVYIINHSRGC